MHTWCTWGRVHIDAEKILLVNCTTVTAVGTQHGEALQA